MRPSAPRISAPGTRRRLPPRGWITSSGGRTPRPRSRQRVIKAVVSEVAEMLGNTPAVARRSYIDPRVLDSYLSGTTIGVEIDQVETLAEVGDRRRREVERALLRMLA